MFVSYTDASAALDAFTGQDSSSVKLIVPKRNQHAPGNGPDADDYCGPAAMGMVLDHFGVHKTTLELAALCGVENGEGTSARKMCRAAKKLGFRILDKEYSPDLDFIKKMIRRGLPLIVGLDIDDARDGHFMVVTGFSGNQLILNDPWDGCEVTLTEKKFMRCWKARRFGCVPFSY